MNIPVAFELSLQGEGVYPETTPLSELVEFLSAIEKAIKALTEAEGTDKEELIVGLVEVKRSSTILRFTSNRPSEVRQAWGTIVGALATKNLEQLPSQAKKLIETSVSYAKKRKASVGFITVPGQPPAVCIDPNTEFPTHETKVRGETVLYGLVTRVGGKEPKVGLSLDNGTFLVCETSRQLAKQLGSRLYEWVGLSGIAEWDTRDWSITAFEARELIEYTAVPITDAIASLARAAGPEAWADVVDIVKEINEFRQG
ncbi:hypothetical protein V3F56_08160 [Moorellaceae bacterium AZ2]